MKYFWIVIVILVVVLAWQLWPRVPDMAIDPVYPEPREEGGDLNQPPVPPVGDDGASTPPPGGETGNGTGPFPPVPNEGNTVTYLDDGYRPLELRVKIGATVFFQNGSINPVRTASAQHPTHQVYPGSDIAKCGSPLAVVIFDSCRGYAPGESWSFIFNEAGTWKYHNHLNATHFGTIIVES